MAKNKILLFVQSLEGGGTERVVCNLSNYLAKKGYSVTIMMLYDHDIAYRIEEGVHIECLNFSTQIYKTKAKNWIKLFGGIGRNNICISFLATPILISLLLRPFIKTKLICTERNYPPSRYSKKLQERLGKLAHRADAWVFQTGQQREWYGKNVKDEKAYVIPNAINTDFLIKPERVRTEKIIVTVGSLQEKKNHKLLIKAFAAITEKFSDYRLRIYGEGELKEKLIALAEELKVADRVEFHGFVNNIPQAIIHAELFVLSSNVEGIPNALIEAMALGLPCISTRCAGGGAEFLIDDGINGLLVPVNDVNALSDAISKILADEGYANYLAQNALKLRNTLSPDVIYKNWENVIEDVIKKK